MKQPIIPPTGERVKLKDFDPGFTNGMKKSDCEEGIEGLRTRLNELQDLLYADKRYALLVVLQAIDTGGKDGTIKSVFREVGPLGCSVASFGVPTDLELRHDYLWRYHLRTPERGQVVIFNRSYYESVLVERVHEIVDKETWTRRYDELNAFEEYLANQQTIVMKFYLHISKDEQQERLQSRVDDPNKRWKFHTADLAERKRWDDYQEAFADMLSNCNTEQAPWHVVPADHKWYRDVVVAKALIERLEGLDLRYPDADKGIEGTKVE
ncbi:MAG: PPK2 family polyphosphate kinase [Tepidiformaceae bacterium]